ncbi:MAG: Mini-ribonuclease 3 [Syntrophomonadaceae bacterium]|jgi:ribonuclease-3 family protein|nr:Mini-ribonuclease 3 [Syntrophomonadaceae bacterium]
MAYVGDAVYELAVRSRKIMDRTRKIRDIHQEVVGLVNAEKQAQFLRKIEDSLTEEEIAVVKRGRNAKTHSVPRHAITADYRWSTGLEALFGYLYLKGDEERLREILEMIDFT